MGKSSSFANSFLLLIFNATTFANVAINATASPITNIYASLHTADVTGLTGDQTTSETTYTSYVRKDVIRTSSGWTVASNVVTPVVAITFANGTGGSGTVTHFGLGSLVSGAGVRFYGGTVTPNITVGNGIMPQLSTASSVTET
jgi:hypothetical protein